MRGHRGSAASSCCPLSRKTETPRSPQPPGTDRYASSLSPVCHKVRHISKENGEEKGGLVSQSNMKKHEKWAAMRCIFQAQQTGAK